MKTIIKITAIFAAIMLTACSSDDNKKTEEPLSERLEYEYATETIIPDGTVVPVMINIEVPDDKKVIDPTKIHIEITLEHEVALDLSFGYLMPNTGNEFKTIVNQLGGFNKYIPQNVFSFNPENTQIINSSENHYYPQQIIPAGKYKEGTNNSEYPVETPLFQSMLNKNIKGQWKFYFLDSVELDEGKVIKIKLIFDEGALQVDEI